MIAVVDYGAGNLCSVVNAIAKLGYQSKITSSIGSVKTKNGGGMTSSALKPGSVLV